MTTALDAREFQARLVRLDALIREVEETADPAGRAHTREIVQAVLDLHGTGLARVLEILEEQGEPGRLVLDACAGDEVASGLLLLHGLHPWGVEDRVRQALDRLRPALVSHGSDVELIGVSDGVARLRLRGGNGCASTASLRQTVEEAVYAQAPDVTQIDIEGMAEADGRGRLSLPVV